MMDKEARAAGVVEASTEDQGEKYGNRIIQKQERLDGELGERGKADPALCHLHRPASLQLGPLLCDSKW